jgi:hypothetical protein
MCRHQWMITVVLVWRLLGLDLPKKRNNFENILPTNFNNDDKEESVSVTSPLDMMMQEKLLDNDSSTVNMLQEEDTEVIVGMFPLDGSPSSTVEKP